MTKKFQKAINLRFCSKRTVSTSGRYLDRPILLFYRSDGTLFSVMSIHWAEIMVSKYPSYFDGLYSELHYYF